MGKVISDLFTIASATAALWAVWLWWCSTRVFPFNPQWGSGKEPATTERDWKAETALFMQSVVRARDLTGKAALWGGTAVVLHVTATILGRIAQPG